MAYGELVAAEVAADAGAEGYFAVLEGGADDVLAVAGFGGGTFGVVAFDLDGAVGVLGEGDAADLGAYAVGQLAVDGADGAGEGVVEGGDFDELVGGVLLEVDVAHFVVDVEGVFVELAGPADGLEEAAIGEDHVVVEEVEGGAGGFALAAPPIFGAGGEEGFPFGAPDSVAEGFPGGGYLRALEDGAFGLVGLEGDALVEGEVAYAVGAAAEDDGVAGGSAGDGGFEVGWLVEGGAL